MLLFPVVSFCVYMSCRSYHFGGHLYRSYYELFIWIQNVKKSNFFLRIYRYRLLKLLRIIECIINFDECFSFSRLLLYSWQKERLPTFIFLRFILLEELFIPWRFINYAKVFADLTVLLSLARILTLGSTDIFCIK